jgi:hypothetical protein
MSNSTWFKEHKELLDKDKIPAVSWWFSLTETEKEVELKKAPIGAI